MSFGCKHSLVILCLHPGMKQMLNLLSYCRPLCQNNFRLSFDSYERFVLVHTTHSSMTRFLVLKNQPCCVVLFYFRLSSIDVLFFFIILRQNLLHVTNCYIFITFPFSLHMPLIATFSSHYLSVSACH